MKYRKKPVVIEAVQFTGSNPDEIRAFCGDKVIINYDDSRWEIGVGAPIAIITIPTLEGTMAVSAGDFVIKGIQGEFYPCKPDIFEQTYEKAD